jgi:hypothetical protein
MSTIAVLWSALGETGGLPPIEIVGNGALPSAFAVSDLAAASVGVAGCAVANLIAQRGADVPLVHVDRRLASMWFGFSVRPQTWTLPPPWDAIAGDYAARDGWIRLHTNAPHHRAVVLSVLQVGTDKITVARAVAQRSAGELETQIVDAGGCAAVMHSAAAWKAHPQGAAVALEPLLDVRTTDSGGDVAVQAPRSRPLAGVRVLDLTRVLAGPVATRFLAGFGADVLRVDPPWWDEPSLVPEVTLGKRCARLDLREREARERFEQLLTRADVLVHGYRDGALERLGLGEERRRALRPGLIDVSLDAYGWSGPWRMRRGFDSLVQMSSGIAEAGMRQFGHDRPFPLPVQALDHAAGYIMAAAAVNGLATRERAGRGSSARTSLARVAKMLLEMPASSEEALEPEPASDLDERIEATAWGPARRLRPPLDVAGAAMSWDRAAGALGSAVPEW